MYALGLFLAVCGSVLLLALHVIIRPSHRRDIGLLAIAFASAILPLIAFSIGDVIGNTPSFTGLSVVMLPVIPAGYAYVIARRQLGGLELRANRWIALFLYTILLISLAALSLSALSGLSEMPGVMISVGVIVALIAGLGSLAIYPRFQRWVEYRLLGMPLPPTGLLETYAARITTSLEMPALVQLLSRDILPSLLVRQSALLQVDESGHSSVVYSVGVVSN